MLEEGSITWTTNLVLSCFTILAKSLRRLSRQVMRLELGSGQSCCYNPKAQHSYGMPVICLPPSFIGKATMGV